jgi:uncharacterized protein (DUF58 family)
MQPRAAQDSDSVASSELAGLAALDRYLSVPLVFALLAAASFLIAWNRGIALMHAVFALFVAVALVSLVGPMLMLRPARVRFALPREGRVGDVVPVEILARAQRWPARRYLVRLLAPFPFAPSRDLFLSVVGDGRACFSRVELRRRGVFEIRRLTAASGYPIGLFTFRREWEVEPIHVTVLPRVHPVARFPVAGNSARLQGELERPSASVGQDLFREVRDYRSGDNPRHIHWRSTAHRGHLVVKQFETIATSETWIVLDLDRASHAGEGEYNSFERAVEIAASIATFLVRSGMRCGVAGGLLEDGTFALWRPPAAGTAHLDSLMYALAAVQADGSADYADVLSAMAVHVRRGQQWILFNHGPRNIAVPDALRGDSAFWFQFQSATFEDPEPPDGEAPPPGHVRDGMVIAANTDIAAIFR